jgi:hypothetical protein
VQSCHIRNRDQILQDIDGKLNGGKPPAVEYFFVEDAVGPSWLCFGFGHACLRYTLPDGQQRMVNIERGTGEGTKQPELIHIIQTTEDYIFGGTGESEGKGGLFSRNIASIRLEEVDEGKILAMHHYFESMIASHHAGVASFVITGGHMQRLWRTFCLAPFYTKALLAGNCSIWTSRALMVAGLISKVHTFPKQIFIDVLESSLMAEGASSEPHASQRKKRANVVYYHQVDRGMR